MTSLALPLFINRRSGTETEGRYFVKKAVDGDTILLANGERVRYIGIDTPETKHPRKPVERFGKEAYEYNKRLVEGKWVRLEFDIEKRDRYGRLLAYVYQDDTFVNAQLVKEGYARVYTFPPNIKHQELFIGLQREAREDNLGLWNR
ncbi:MAG: thermonuclease family protein [Candidatus Omnitrophota bacterium]